MSKLGKIEIPVVAKINISKDLKLSLIETLIKLEDGEDLLRDLIEIRDCYNGYEGKEVSE